MINKSSLILSACSALCSCVLATNAPLHPLDVVSQVDLARYAGKWYEIARYPNRFQKGCADSSAVYTLTPDGSINVLNSCLKNGVLKTAKGVARVVDKTTNAKLKVSFFRPFWGDYWIIDLGADYDYAVVSAPSRKYLWILARSPRMDDALYAQILGRLQAKGFDIDRLEKRDTSFKISS